LGLTFRPSGGPAQHGGRHDPLVARSNKPAPLIYTPTLQRPPLNLIHAHTAPAANPKPNPLRGSARRPPPPLQSPSPPRLPTVGMALRPPQFCPPRSRPGGDSSVPMNLTSIDADEYRAGYNGGPQGDDGEDLRTADLFRVVDGDDGVGMATPSSTASTTTPIATPTLTPIPTTMPTATATPTPPLGARAEDKDNVNHPGTSTGTQPQDPCVNFRCVE
jgi:hypothetical protein